MQRAAVIIGGGFFGCSIALHLHARGFAPVTVCEREERLLARASYANQARVHNGYHYPRSYLTACRSRANMAQFAREYAPALKRDYTSLYAIAARRSKVMPAQYERFMSDIGAQFERAGSSFSRLFDPRLTAAVYVTEEYAFDAARLREVLSTQLARAGVDIRLGTEALRVRPEGAGALVELRTPGGLQTLQAGLVINCGYARINWNVRDAANGSALKHEIAEIALVDVPQELRTVGITVMDGPFFSCMPFPAEECHSLSHVRYTPHAQALDPDGTQDPLTLLASAEPHSRCARMLADAARFVPLLRRARQRRSLFEIKTVLAQHEVDDGRPILLRRDFGHPAVLSVLGGKLDNVYDVLVELDRLLATTLSSAVTEAA
jgi:glycine/D-amino acid oxidase-like deaminating enzyme